MRIVANYVCQHIAKRTFCIAIMKQFTESQTIKISKIQKKTLNKLDSYGYNVSKFIRDAISEKIKREHPKEIVKETFVMPF